MEKLEEIQKLKSLLDQGAITQDEFTTLKKNLLAENKGASGLDLSSVNNETVTGKKATKKVLLPEDKLAQKEAKKTLRQMDLDVVQWNLIYFIQANESQTVKLLLAAGLNPNSAFYDEKQKRNFYALHQAARFSEPDIIQILIDCGAKINLQDDDGYTPLFYAIEVGKNNNLNVLIEKGADLNHKNKAGINPLYYAKKYKKPAMLELLLRAGAKEMPINEIKSIEKRKLLKKILIAAVVIGFFWFVGNAIFSTSSDSSSDSSSNSTSSSSYESSSSSGSHTCSWCGSSFTGYGYFHLGTGCANGDKNIQGNMCSTRCCQEEWLTDANNPNKSRR